MNFDEYEKKIIIQPSSFFHTLHISPCGGVDFDQVALLAEKRHAHLGAGFDGGRFQCIGSSVAAQSRLSVGDLKDNRLR